MKEYHSPRSVNFLTSASFIIPLAAVGAAVSAVASAAAAGAALGAAAEAFKSRMDGIHLGRLAPVC